MANAFSTKGSTTNGTGLSLTGLTKTMIDNATPKAKALNTAKTTPIIKTSNIPTNYGTVSISNVNKATSTPQTAPKTAPVTPKTPPTTGVMTNSAINTPKPTNTGMINQPTTQQTAPVNTPKPTVTPIPTYSGLVGTLAQKASQPNEQYTDLTKQAEDAYKKAANFGRAVGQAKLDVATNPEYSIDTGVGLGNRIAQNTGLQMQELTDTAAGLANLAGLSNTQQQLQQSGLTSAAGLAQPTQVSYSNQYINPLTGQPVGGGVSGNLNDAVNNVVEKLQSGQMTYNDALTALSGYGQGGVNALQAALPSGFNIAQSNVLGGVQGTVGPAYTYADTALKNVEDIMANLPKLQQTNIPVLNEATRGFSTLTGIGSEGTRALTGAVNTLRNAYASLLASSKGGTPTDYSGQALAEIPDNPTPNDIAALRKNLETLGQARKQIYGSAGNQPSSTNNSAFAEQW